MNRRRERRQHHEEASEHYPLYLCLGEPPEDEVVCCFRARRIPDPEASPDVPPVWGYEVDVSGGPALAISFARRWREDTDGYLLTGREVGTSSDDGLLLADVAAEPLPPGTWVQTPSGHHAVEAEASLREYPLYVRFGDLPIGGRSRRVPVLPAYEDGVSCFRARRTPEGDIVADVAGSFAVASMFECFSRAGRPAYLIRGGVEVGVGSGGEVLLGGEGMRSTRIPAGVRVVASEDRTVGRWFARRGFEILGGVKRGKREG